MAHLLNHSPPEGEEERNNFCLRHRTVEVASDGMDTIPHNTSRLSINALNDDSNLESKFLKSTIKMWQKVDTGVLFKKGSRA